ncbi:MAG: spore maturation protein [Lachnospiraceae bacterium]|nr:spore maturation protein [Lachnospiraceae bacterium]MBR1568803.1 spore maturation protein [Lachnospiraceae bacterium]
MQVIMVISSFMIPLVIFYIVGYGILNREKVYDIFVEGVKEGFRIVIGIAPTLVGLMLAVGIIRNSGAMDLVSKLISPAAERLFIPAEVIPVILIRLFSTSAANGLVFDIFKEYGTDSKIGLMVSIIMSCTESMFYVMSVYLVAVKVRKPRWILSGGLLATAAGVIAGLVIAGFMV